MADPVSQPWERLDGETSRAYAAFRAFRDLGPTRVVGAVPDCSANSLARWSRRHRWIERASAWDAETYRLEDAKRLEAAQAMNENHQRVARFLIAEGLRAIGEGQALTPHQAARYVDLGTRIERAVVLGERLNPVGGPVPVDEDLSPLERIARELGSSA